MFSRFWDFLLPFSFKTRESDLTNAPLRFRKLEVVEEHGPRQRVSFGKEPDTQFLRWKTDNLSECAYGFRYVELNHRATAQRDNPDYDPWSIRQSVVYQRHDIALSRNVFILISPSETARKNLEDEVGRALSWAEGTNPFDLHRILISTLQENWRFYIRSLENLIQTQVITISPTSARQVLICVVRASYIGTASR